MQELPRRSAWAGRPVAVAALWRLAREGFAFAVAGSLGFVTHAGVLALLVVGWGIPPYPAWFPAFAVAVTVTYAVNRGWAFRHRAGEDITREFVRYVVLQSGGAVLNNLVYAAALWADPVFRAQPVLALAAGAIAGMGANFVSARQLAFRGDRTA